MFSSPKDSVHSWKDKKRDATQLGKVWYHYEAKILLIEDLDKYAACGLRDVN